MREFMLVLHFIGLAMGLGTSFAMMFLGIASAKMEPAKAREFMGNAFVLSRMGHIGIALLLISGLYLIMPYWSVLVDTPLLIAKLTLFLVLAALVGIISARARRAKASGDEAAMKSLPALGRLGLLTALTIVVLAVLVFH